AGYFARMFRGDITYFRGFVLVAIVEVIHLTIILPLLSDIDSFAQYLEIVHVTLFPMIFAVSLGIMLFIYIVRLKGHSLTTRFEKETTQENSDESGTKQEREP
ncbi:MAG: hypothetical protein GX097_05590, partial [Methanomicrobiales archaeon]|nr:hypothetical protein [Methanomicrobiales archaeon]